MSYLEIEETALDEANDGELCASCETTLAGELFLVNGEAPICNACRIAMENWGADSTSATRLVRALGFGAVAAALGSLLYFAILYFTGYEFSLVAIIVGIMVGKAVSTGSFGRGGLGYQLLAVALTYSAIVATYMPFILEAMLEDRPAIEETASAQPAAAAESNETFVPTTADMFLALAILFALAAATPVLAGVENILGMAIIAFGLYQAWIMSRGEDQEITGPFRAGAVPERTLDLSGAWPE